MTVLWLKYMLHKLHTLYMILIVTWLHTWVSSYIQSTYANSLLWQCQHRGNISMHLPRVNIIHIKVCHTINYAQIICKQHQSDWLSGWLAVVSQRPWLLMFTLMLNTIASVCDYKYHKNLKKNAFHCFCMHLWK